MTFDKETERLKLKMQLRLMEGVARSCGSDHFEKVEMARVALRETQKLDPHVMTVAMTMVGCEGFLELLDRQGELMMEMAKNGFKP